MKIVLKSNAIVVQQAAKKSGTVKSGTVKKADGAGHSKALGSVVVEDIEVSC